MREMRGDSISVHYKAAFAPGALLRSPSLLAVLHFEKTSAKSSAGCKTFVPIVPLTVFGSFDQLLTLNMPVANVFIA